MADAQKRIFLTKVDKKLFESIYVDRVFIYIGYYKERISEAGLYNQICAYFNAKRKIDKFYIWLCESYRVIPIEPVPEEIVTQWENKLILNTRSTIYAEVLRLERCSDQGFNFYSFKNKGRELRFLCSMDQNPNYMTQLRQFLKYNDIITQICDIQQIEHPIEKTDREIRQDIDRCLRYQLIPIIEEGVNILANHKECYCLAYYDLTCGDASKPTPAWDSFMASIPDDGSKECFMAFIYSIFKGDNFGKQMLWIHGIGDSGKSKIVQTLKKRLEALNPTIVTSLTPSLAQDKFTTFTHTKKRLVIAQDCADRGIVRSQLVKNITGNDDATIRGMGKEAQMANIYSKLIISSNYAPWINPTKTEEISRILYINLDSEAIYQARSSWTPDKGDWVFLLYKEIDNFIAKCEKSYYDTLSQDGHNIIYYPKMIEKLTTFTYLSEYLSMWWNSCIQPFKSITEKKKSNVILFDDLCKDYSRYIGKQQFKITPRSLAMKLVPFLLEHGVTVHTLTDAFAGKYIMGYEFIELLPSKRERLQQTLEQRTNEIGKKGIPEGKIYAFRKPEERIGWCHEKKIPN